MALIHKQNDDFDESLAASVDALKADPTNWKALVNKADLKSRIAQVDQAGKDADKEALLATHKEALADSMTALGLPKAD